MTEPATGSSEPRMTGELLTTGDSRVDELVARLDELDALELEGQLQLFGELHTALAAILDEPPLDDDEGDAAPA